MSLGWPLILWPTVLQKLWGGDGQNGPQGKECGRPSDSYACVWSSSADFASRWTSLGKTLDLSMPQFLHWEIWHIYIHSVGLWWFWWNEMIHWKHVAGDECSNQPLSLSWYIETGYGRTSRGRETHWKHSSWASWNGHQERLACRHLHGDTTEHTHSISIPSS